MALVRLLVYTVYSFGLKARNMAHMASLTPGGQGGVEAAIVVILGDDGTAGVVDVTGIGLTITDGAAAWTRDIDLW